MTKIKLDIDALVASGLITEKKKSEILAWNETETAGQGISKFLQIFASFGAIVTGLGIFLLIAANWDSMTDITKTVIMIGSTIGVYGLGYYWTYINTNYPKTGEAIILLGSMFYGASIFLLGQIYNLGGNLSGALLVWALGIIPLAYATGFVSIFLLGIVLIYSFTFSEIFDTFSLSGFVVTNIFIALGYLSLSLIRYHKDNIYYTFGKILSWTGGASMLGGLFAYTFLDFWRYGGESWNNSSDESTTMWFLFGLIGVGAIAIIVDVIRKGRLSNSGDVPFLIGLLPIILIFFYTLSDMVSLTTYSYNQPMTTLDITRGALMNLLYIAIIGLMIWTGVRRDNRSIVNIAMIFLALYIFGKYLSFAFESKMDGAFIFIGGGIACIVTTILVEKIRRRIIFTMD